MLEILLILVANVFEQLRVRHEFDFNRDGPGSHIGLRVVERRFQLHVSKIDAAKTFCDTEILRVRMATYVEPCLVIESGALNHQCVPVPVAHRISLPAGIRIFGEPPTVREHLAECRWEWIRLGEKRYDTGRLYDLVEPRADLRTRTRETMRGGIVLSEARLPFLVQLFRPGGNLTRFQVGGDIQSVSARMCTPDSRQI